MNKVIDALNDNLKVIYRKAVDADTALNTLQASGKGKFKTIFGENTEFTTRSKRFTPYVEEIAGEVAVLVDADESSLNAALPSLVKKIESILTTLDQFKRSL